MRIVTQQTASDATANWAIEIDRDRGRPEYVSAEAIEADGENITIYTTKGEEVTLRRDRVRRILLMRTLATASK
jgi:hypothetical protein